VPKHVGELKNTLSACKAGAANQTYRMIWVRVEVSFEASCEYFGGYFGEMFK